MCDRIFDQIGLQTFVGRKFGPTYNFKSMEYFFYIQLYGFSNYVDVI